MIANENASSYRCMSCGRPSADLLRLSGNSQWRTKSLRMTSTTRRQLCGPLEDGVKLEDWPSRGSGACLPSACTFKSSCVLSEANGEVPFTLYVVGPLSQVSLAPRSPCAIANASRVFDFARLRGNHCRLLPIRPSLAESATRACVVGTSMQRCR